MKNENDFVFKGGITKYWWIPLITGLLAVGIGIWCLCSPVSSLPVLAYTMAIIFCVAGLMNVCFSIANSKNISGWGWPLAMGIIELCLGIWLLFMPLPVLTVTFIYAVGIYLIFVAINAICELCSVYSGSFSWIGWLIAMLLVVILFSFIFLAGPIAGGVAVWLWIGISFIFFGCYRISLAFAIRSINRKIRF